MFTGVPDTDRMICHYLNLHDLQQFLLVNRYLCDLIIKSMKKVINKIDDLIIDAKMGIKKLYCNAKPCTFYNYLVHVKSFGQFVNYSCLRLHNVDLVLRISYKQCGFYHLTIYSHDRDCMIMYNLTSKQLRSLLYDFYHLING